MFVRIDEEEFNAHAEELGEAICEFTRLGAWITQWDNGMGCGLLKLNSPETGETRFIHYQ